MPARRLFLAALVIAFGLAPAAAAKSVRLHLTGAAARATAGHQEHELGWGAATPGAAELPIFDQLGLQLEVGGVWLSEAERPEDPMFEAQGSAAALSAGAGVRARPFADSSKARALSSAGFWLAGAGGMATSNGLVRPMLDAHVGYDVMFSQGTLGMGPTVGYLHVFQPNSELRPADASIFLVGLHAVFDTARSSEGDVDRDGDGIENALDQCPDDPEDFDRFADRDGCPELDNDDDGIVDDRDRCPNVAEDNDAFEDSDGCPEADNDKDGVSDEVDRCPIDAEDKDEFEDRDGCPDLDNDRDGIADRSDSCPNEPETKNGYADEDGCPDEKDVRVVGSQILLEDRVHFWTNSHIIHAQSYALMRRLAKLVKEHPEYVHIEVAGHADERGPDTFNNPLSLKRAQSVVAFLIKHGVDPSRLSAVGFGETLPLEKGRSQGVWYKNRRVEFRITREVRTETGRTLRKTVVTTDPTRESSPPAGGDRR
jgi:outer membrane protein OmpA-like peptidoglycan-associated protein